MKFLQKMVVAWANTAFPDRTSQDILLKFTEELGELIEKPSDPMEYADIMILLLDLADKHALPWPDIVEATWRKLEINQSRAWVVDEHTRIMHHVKDEEESKDDK